MDDSKFLALLVFLGLVAWELYYIVGNFGWLPYLYIAFFTTAQSICVKAAGLRK